MALTLNFLGDLGKMIVLFLLFIAAQCLSEIHQWALWRTSFPPQSFHSAESSFDLFPRPSDQFAFDLKSTDIPNLSPLLMRHSNLGWMRGTHSVEVDDTPSLQFDPQLGDAGDLRQSVERWTKPPLQLDSRPLG